MSSSSLWLLLVVDIAAGIVGLGGEGGGSGDATAEVVGVVMISPSSRLCSNDVADDVVCCFVFVFTSAAGDLLLLSGEVKPMPLLLW